MKIEGLRYTTKVLKLLLFFRLRLKLLLFSLQTPREPISRCSQIWAITLRPFRPMSPRSLLPQFPPALVLQDIRHLTAHILHILEKKNSFISFKYISTGDALLIASKYKIYIQLNTNVLPQMGR